VTPPEVREQREKERELKELDRDIRTVFAYNLPLKADERDLFEFFSKAGTVEDVRIIMDRNTRKSKGFAYIEYANRVSVEWLGWVVARIFRCLSRVHSALHLICSIHSLCYGDRLQNGLSAEQWLLTTDLGFVLCRRTLSMRSL
jgi:hypothetical protein